MSVVSLSKKLFVLPKIKTLAFVYSSLVLIFGFLDFSMLLFTILITLTTLCSIKLLKLRFNLKRVLFLSILVAVLSFSSFIISGSFSGSFFLFLAVIYFCSERGFIPAVLVSAIPFLIVEPSSFFVIFISSVLFYIYLKLMDVKIKNSTMREFVESFVRFWLTNEPRYAEEILIKNSEVFSGRVRCIKINEFKLISTDFHPGPFRNVGGAKLVDSLGLPEGVYLHSPSSHERNPVSKEEVEKIRSALNFDWIEIFPFRPFELESDNFKVFCLPFDKIKLIFVSGKKRLDDFVINSKNFVVDCHNANFFGDLTIDEIKEIEKLVRIAENTNSEPISEVYGAFIKINAETESISRYVSAILLDYGFVRYVIVVFDSNNVLPEFREIVEKKFLEIGFKAVVCSTDNHAKTGINIKESYKPAGAVAEDSELLKILLERCKNPEYEKLSFSYGESVVSVKVLGSLKDKIEEVANKAGRYVYLFFIFVFISWLLAIMIPKSI
ncbi:MAG: DUF2070 family protein [Archaeoglobaceae archaeon]